MVFMDGLAQKSKLTKFYYLVIAKVNQDMLDTVSYTHLTLPTIYSV